MSMSIQVVIRNGNTVSILGLESSVNVDLGSFFSFFFLPMSASIASGNIPGVILRTICKRAPE